MRYDRDEIIRDSNEHLNRRIDAFDAETAATARRDEFYEKLIDGDHDGLRWMFGIDPATSDGVSDRTSSRKPSLQDARRRHSIDFKAGVESSQYIPPDVADRWVDAVDSIDLNEYRDGHDVLNSIESELVNVRLASKPARDIFSMSPSKEMHHMRSFDRIEDDLRKLRRLLDVVGRFAQGGA